MLVRPDRERERRLLRVQLAKDFVDPGLAGEARASALPRPPHLLHVDVVAQAQEYRSAQVPVVGPALEFHLGDQLRLRPRPSVRSGRRASPRMETCAERSGSSCAWTCASVLSSKPEPTCEA